MYAFTRMSARVFFITISESHATTTDNLHSLRATIRQVTACARVSAATLPHNLTHFSHLAITASAYSCAPVINFHLTRMYDVVRVCIRSLSRMLVIKEVAVWCLNEFINFNIQLCVMRQQILFGFIHENETWNETFAVIRTWYNIAGCLRLNEIRCSNVTALFIARSVSFSQPCSTVVHANTIFGFSNLLERHFIDFLIRNNYYCCECMLVFLLAIVNHDGIVITINRVFYNSDMTMKRTFVVVSQRPRDHNEIQSCTHLPH